MIIRPSGASQLLITQPDHAMLAAHIMRHWMADGLPASPRRALILAAIEEHDNGWREVDASPLVHPDTGEVLDFMTAPDSVKRGVWPRAVGRLAGTPYVAALVAHHAVHVYRRYRTHPDWVSFFAEMEVTRDRQLSAGGSVLFEEFLRDYIFLRIGDLLSLMFCNAWSEPQAQDDMLGYTARLDGSRLLISPDPFDGRSVALEVAARALGSAEPVIVRGVASGS